MRAAVWGWALCLLGVSGCLQVEGGAVEIGWDLRYADGRRINADGEFIDCQEVGLETMALALVSRETEEDVCRDSQDCRFDCSHFGTGTTPFVITEGRYSMALHILDAQGATLGPADGVVVPGPVVRPVRRGEITDLDVNLIIVDR